MVIDDIKKNLNQINNQNPSSNNDNSKMTKERAREILGGKSTNQNGNLPSQGDYVVPENVFIPSSGTGSTGSQSEPSVSTVNDFSKI